MKRVLLGLAAIAVSLPLGVFAETSAKLDAFKTEIHQVRSLFANDGTQATFDATAKTAAESTEILPALPGATPILTPIQQKLLCRCAIANSLGQRIRCQVLKCRLTGEGCRR